jgi:glucose-1-phosphate thymidylyltransferase
MWGIVPAAGRGTRLQPLAFSKELIPLGSRVENGIERPCAVSEYLLERMIIGGADKICIVISPDKSDILGYFGDSYGSAHLVYAVQPRPCGLCDAVFSAHPLMTDGEPVIVGLPDTIWFPQSALATLPDDILSFLLFPVERPEFFDAVVLDSAGWVSAIEVKQPHPSSHWIWGALKMPGRLFAALRRLWIARCCADEYFGSLINAYLTDGGTALGVRAGAAYVDVGTLNGYRAAMALLAEQSHMGAPAKAVQAIGWPAGRLPKTLAQRAGVSPPPPYLPGARE